MDCNGTPGVDEPADPAPQPPLSQLATMNCTHVYRCGAAGRGALYYRNGVGWTNFAGSNTVWTGYAPQGSFSGGTYPPGTYRISHGGSGTKMGAAEHTYFTGLSYGNGQFYTAP